MTEQRKERLTAIRAQASRPWYDYWYETNCCKIGAMCPEHLAKHRAACGYPDIKCDVCVYNDGPPIRS